MIETDPFHVTLLLFLLQSELRLAASARDRRVTQGSKLKNTDGDFH